MMTNRLILALLTVTILMQVGIMYRQGGGSTFPVAAVRDAPDGFLIDLVDVPVEGAGDADAVLIEFSDYECPFCQQHAAGVRKQLVEKYVATGRIRYAFANNPLPMHPSAPLMAAAAICAGDQGFYWDMHDRLFESKATSRAAVIELAESLELDANVFVECLDKSPMPTQIIDRDVQNAQALGLSGTPGFALGLVNSEGVVRVRRLISGAQPLETFESELEVLLGTGEEPE